MDKIKPRTLSGFMELQPDKQVQMDKMRAVLAETYARYGFTPLDTPAIEAAEVLLAKGGGETEKQIYRFQKGDSDLALRFDLTVPLAAAIRSARSTAASAPSAAASVSSIRRTSTSSATASSPLPTRLRSRRSSTGPSPRSACAGSRSASITARS